MTVDYVSPVVVFVIAWWLVFFILLPIGVKSPEEAGEEVIPGTSEGAPVNPGLKWKAGLATLGAAVILGLFYLIQHFNLISFR